jgi:hypothetical protein
MPSVDKKLRPNRVESAPPTSEIGGVLNGIFSIDGMKPWGHYVDQDEYVPELVWPRSVQVYEQMSTDTQLAALYQGTVLPIRHFNWSLDPNEADDEIVERISRDLNLPIQGDEQKDQPRLRQKNRFSFHDHLRKALYAGKYGHYFFEQVGEIGEDGFWSLRKLAERPPKTIQNIAVAPDGGLVYIEQNINPHNQTIRNMGQAPQIPVDRLVAYVWEQEGGDWVGRSWFRECYKNWLIKDRLMRVDATNHEKAGGIIYGIAPQGATPAEQKRIAELAQQAKVGMDSGAGLPAGTDLEILRAAGTDVVGSMRYHDEAMARRFLLMILQLGQTQTGSRALGSTFVDFFGDGITAIADWFVDTFCEHVIEDHVDWNWGPEVEPVPRLHFEFDPELVVNDLALMLREGLIVADDELEEEVRRELGLPRKGEPRQSVEEKALELKQQMDSQDSQSPPSGQAKPASPTKAESARAGSVEGAPSRHPARVINRPRRRSR